jgi:cytochrome c-type biogenesis protein CcmH/NrfG
MQKPLAAKFEQISFISLLVTCSVLPFVFLPGAVSGIGATKGVLFFIGVLLSATLWLIGVFIEGSISYIRSRALLFLLGAVVLTLVSALASANARVSLWGIGFSIDSFSAIAILTMLTVVAAYFARDKKRLRTLLFTLFFAGSFTIVLQLILFLLRSVPFMTTYFSGVTISGTIVGSWANFALFCSFMFSFGILMFELFVPSGFLKIVSIGTVGLSIVSLVFLNFAPAWILVLVISLLLFIYKMSVERSIKYGLPEEVGKANASFPFLSFGALIIGLFFVLTTGTIGTGLARFAGIAFNDARPSLSASTHIVQSSLMHDPILGIGSGRYGVAWNQYHLPEVNMGLYWNTTFSNGFNVPLTMSVTLGLLPTLLFIAYFISVLLIGIKVVGKSVEDRTIRFLAITVLVLFTLLFIAALLSVPGMVEIILLFLLGGVIIGMSETRGMSEYRTMHFLADPRASFFAVTLMTGVILVGCVGMFLSGMRFASIVFYNRALAAKDMQTALRRLGRADALSHSDLYYRTAAALYSNDFTAHSQSASPDMAILQNDFSGAESNATAAVAWDNSNALNWYTLSQVYQLALSANKDAVSNATAALAKAQALAPQNPLFELTAAQLSLAQKDQMSAIGHIQKAIALKANYLDAYLLEAQLKQSNNDLQGAVDILNNYVKVAPYDDQGFGVLGLAYINLKDYSNALAAFRSARTLNPYNSNYYLLYIKTLYLSGNRVTAEQEAVSFKKQFPNLGNQVDNLSQISTTLPDPQITESTDTETEMDTGQKTESKKRQ